MQTHACTHTYMNFIEKHTAHTTVVFVAIGTIDIAAISETSFFNAIRSLNVFWSVNN